MNRSNQPLIAHIQDFLDYCDVVKGLSSKTVENYQHFLTPFRLWLEKNNLQDIKPHELDQEYVYKYRLYLSRHRRGKGKDDKELKKNTQNYYLIALRALLLYFSKKDIPCLSADKIGLAKQQKIQKVKFLNLEQIEKLLLSPTPKTISGIRDRAILEMLFSTGMRVGEIVLLNRDQMNLVHLKNHLSDGLEVPITGKGGYPRTVYLSNRALEWLVKYLEKRTDISMALFVNSKQKKRRLTARSIQRIIKKYARLAGLPPSTSPHTIRHSYATDLLGQGVDLRAIQEFLGHRSIATTQIYTHVTNKQLREIHKKFHGGMKLKK